MPVYIKKSKKGEIFYYCVYYDGPKRVWESFGPSPEGKKSAQARDLEIKLRKKRGTWHNGESGSIAFAELAQIYINERHIELNNKTRDEILRTLSKYVLPVIGKKYLNNVAMNDWSRIQQEMIENGASARTVNTYFRYMSRIWRWAVVNEYVKENPWRNR